MKKIIASLIILILTIISITFLYKNNQIKQYSTNLFYMDTYINVKIYTNNEKKAKEALKLSNTIYETYHKLTDRYNPDSEISYIKNNTSNETIITIDSKLYELLEYSLNYYDKTNSLFNINLGNIIDVWKKYRTKGIGIPTINELKNSGSISIKDIQLMPNNQIKNTKPNIDLGSIAKGYATEILGEELKKIGINQFIINAGGNVLVGDKTDKGLYKIGIESPTKDGSIYQIVKGENIAVVTSGSYERFYEYNNQIYHHIINPNTYFPPNYMKSVTVISKSSAQADILTTALFLMPIEDGQKFIKQFDAEAIWYTNDNKIIKSEGFNNYE